MQDERGIMAFDRDQVADLLVQCHRRCCICHRFCGFKMETDHITPPNEGGTDDIDNALPVCFECHAEIHCYNTDHPRGRKFTAEELVSKREDVKRTLDILLTERVESIDGVQYFEVIQVSLTDFQFSSSFSQAIDQKVEQEQIALTEQNRLLTIEYQQQQKELQQQE